jgi:hypothetical protein
LRFSIASATSGLACGDKAHLWSSPNRGADIDLDNLLALRRDELNLEGARLLPEVHLPEALPTAIHRRILADVRSRGIRLIKKVTCLKLPDETDGI